VAGGHWGIMAPCPAGMHADVPQCQASHAATPQHQVRGDIRFSPAMEGTGNRAEQHPGCLAGGCQLQGTEKVTTGHRQAGQVDHGGSEEVLGLRLALQVVGEGLHVPATCREAAVSASGMARQAPRQRSLLPACCSSPAGCSGARGITTLKARNSEVPQHEAGPSKISCVPPLAGEVEGKEQLGQLPSSAPTPLSWQNIGQNGKQRGMWGPVMRLPISPLGQGEPGPPAKGGPTSTWQPCRAQDIPALGGTL